MAARVALSRHEPDEAIGHAEAAHTADPALPIPQFVRGRIAYDEGRYDDALVAFEEAAKALDASGRTLRELQQYLGESLVKLERPAEAESHFAEEQRNFPAAIDVAPPPSRRRAR
jgi:tetratricopeptide (TPR) repeat protein